MPIFEYACCECGKDCELLIRSGAQPVCPYCGSLQLEKQLSLPAAPGKSAHIIRAARHQAKREGHFSHYSQADRKRIK